MKIRLVALGLLVLACSAVPTWATASALSQGQENTVTASSLPTSADKLRPAMYEIVTADKFKALLEKKNYVEAQQIIDQLASFPDLTAYETYVINRLKISLGTATENTSMVIDALPPVIDSGRLDSADKKKFIQAMATYLYNAKNFSGANQWYQRLKED